MGGRSPSGEEWRNVPGYGCAYIVSDLGRVRNINTGKLLFGDTDPKGYRRVNLGGKHKRVSRLVCEAFHGHCPDGLECAHLDGNHTNNRAENLAWVTRSENTRHSIAHGTFYRSRHAGEGHPQAKLSADQISKIRGMAEAGMSRRAIAKEFGISTTQAHRIVTKERWANV
jgi:hypothetical protein